MSGTCKVCSHQLRKDIDRALARGSSPAWLARRVLNLSKKGPVTVRLSYGAKFCLKMNRKVPEMVLEEEHGTTMLLYGRQALSIRPDLKSESAISSRTRNFLQCLGGKYSQ